MYCEIFKWLFERNTPDGFYKEQYLLSLLKVAKATSNKNRRRMKYIFSKLDNIFNRTNYFENYKFNWVN